VQNNEKSPSAFAISIACALNFHHSCFNHRRGKTSPRIAPPNKNYAPHFTHYAAKNLTFFILSLVTVSKSDKSQKDIRSSDRPEIGTKKTSLFLYSLVTVSKSDFYNSQDRLEIVTKKTSLFLYHSLS
jgi:hypothetical protein